MTPAEARHSAPWFSAARRGGHLLGLGVSVVVHLLALLLGIVAAGSTAPHEVARPVVFVEVQPLVRRGRAPTEQEKKLLPRIQPAAKPEAEEVHLGPVKPEPDPKAEQEKKKAERQQREEEARRREEERERKRRMQRALASLNTPETSRSVEDLPVGRPDGDAAGRAREGALKASYLHRVGEALRQEWKVSFIPEEELRHLRGKVKITIDRNGILLSYSWASRSPNPEFNASVDACLKHFTREGDRRLPPFPDDRAFGQSVTYLYTFRSTQ